MSVENQATAESTVIDERIVGVNGQAESSGGCASAVVDDGKLDTVDGTKNPGMKSDFSGARSWFEGLDAEQRSQAMSFSDDLFLETFLASLPWSTVEAGIQPDCSVEWETNVDISTLKNMWVKQMEKDPKATGSSPRLEVQSITDAAKNSIETSEFGEEEDFRIRGSEESKEEEDQLKLVHVTAPLRNLLDSIRIALPAAVSFSAASTNSDDCSYIVFTTSILENIKGEELCSSLDLASQELFNASFLSIGDCLNKLEGCLQRSGTGTPVGSVPFVAVILLRLEKAIMDSYARSFVIIPNTSDNVNEEPASVPEKFLLLSQLDECKRNMYKLESQLEKGQVLDVVQPFKVSLAIGNSLDFVPLDSLILTPLQCFTAIKSGITSLAAINDGAKQSLKLLESAKSQTEIVMVDDDDCAEKLVLGNDSQIMKKKKKRSKRRKPRKSSHDESAGNLGKVPCEAQPTLKVEQPVTADKQNVKKQPMETVKDDTTQIQKPHVLKEETVEHSDSDDAESLVSKHSTVSDKEIETNESDFNVIRKEGVMVIATTAAVDLDNKHGEDQVAAGDSEQHHEDDEDNWETVEVRGKANRKKTNDRGATHGSRRNNTSAKGHSADASGSKRNKHRTSSSRKKNANRKVVRDIISNVLDTVEDEVRGKTKKSASAAPGLNQWKSGPPPGASPRSPQPKKGQSGIEPSVESKKPATLRDIVLGKSSTTQQKPVAVEQVISVQSRLAKVEEKKRGNEPVKKQTQSSSLQPKLPPKLSKGQSGNGLADQNTAPTYQETVSAVSASSNRKAEEKQDANAVEDRASKSDLSSGDTDEAPQNRERAPVLETQSDVSPNPPFPTLLSPENANSATSSVASSLEVPHGSHRHHAGSASDANDVGYHLLDVCDRLSRDMSLFMSRRALALNARRRERGALLGALQDVASSIWPGRCHVELYGSCATQLDLPSSDIDVVVLGLDRLMVNHPIDPTYGRSKSGSNDSLSSKKGETATGRTRQRPTAPVRAASLPVSGFVPMPPQINADRVIRLASKLEQQPWAVRVNPIPTASVPVVKVLADPSKLMGFGQSNDWVSHQHPLSGHAAVGPTQTLHPWRGADVMNGLLSLDITFEGPEHGGIGSTQFSARVVTEVCQEAGLLPDATPFVQVLMVLKELLAQRKLNEPYSGGLSSYALLLLVVALMRERGVIREELERVERQRMAVASGDASTSFGSTRGQRVAPFSTVDANLKSHLHAALASDRNLATHEQDITCSSMPSRKSPATSSWASIAKIYSSGDQSSVQSAPQTQSKTGNVENKSHQKAASFARAAARSQPVSVQSGVIDNDLNGGASKRMDSVSSVLSQQRGSERVKSLGENATQGSFVDDHAGVMPLQDVPLGGTPSFFPQGFNDIIEVLCSGETTAGKLLMHFLLFYGQHFDAQTTAIDVSGKHERGFDHGQVPPYSYLSPYIQRRAPGSIDPVTGMLTVDPIVIYDPLEGAENNNVARRCFCWNSVRWIFAQSYATLSSAVERSATPPSTPNHKTTGALATRVGAPGPDAAVEDSCDIMDPSSSLLRCLLSF